MKKQKKSILTVSNKKAENNRLLKLVKNHIKTFYDAIKERLDNFRKNDTQWAKDLFIIYESHFEKVFVKTRQ